MTFVGHLSQGDLNSELCRSHHHYAAPGMRWVSSRAHGDADRCEIEIDRGPWVTALRAERLSMVFKPFDSTLDDGEHAGRLQDDEPACLADVRCRGPL